MNAGGVSTGEVGADVNFSDFGVAFKGLFKTDKPTLEASWKVSDKIPVDGLSAKVHFDATDKSQTAGGTAFGCFVCVCVLRLSGARSLRCV